MSENEIRDIEKQLNELNLWSEVFEGFNLQFKNCGGVYEFRNCPECNSEAHTIRFSSNGVFYRWHCSGCRADKYGSSFVNLIKLFRPALSEEQIIQRVNLRVKGAQNQQHYRQQKFLRKLEEQYGVYNSQPRAIENDSHARCGRSNKRSDSKERKHTSRRTRKDT